MRAGLAAAAAAAAALPQSLNPDAAAALAAAASDAARRRHSQTTPLHVAAALLALPSALLRRACSLSHHPPIHPLHCRALDLCFSVALDRLSTLTSTPSSPSSNPNPNPSSPPPPLSNALIAALKRAHGHAHHGGVGIPHLALAILDDPSVSRVMREASFSSPAIKATLHLISLSPSPSPGSGPRASPDAAKVLEVLRRPRKRNPVLVGDAGTGPVATEALLAARSFARVLSLQLPLFTELPRVHTWVRDLGALIEARLGCCCGGGGVVGGVVVDLGDLTWLVEAPRGPTGSAAVAEVGRMLRRFGERALRGGGHVWVLGTATCATYLRCQVYHPTMERDWDLQAVPIAPRARTLPSHSSVDIFAPSAVDGTAATAPPCGAYSQSEALRRPCAQNCERELAKISAEEFGPESGSRPNPNMTEWLQIAVPSHAGSDRLQGEDRELGRKQKAGAGELRNRWRETCRRRRHFVRPFESSVKTDLVLGPSAPNDAPEKGAGVSSDSDSLRRLCEGLAEKVEWQRESASAVAAAVVRNKSGNGKPRGLRPKADTWLLFAGPDKVGKRKMAYALSELVFGGPPVSIRVGNSRIDDGDGDGESDVNLRGKTVVDRVADAIGQSPFCVVVLDDVDHVDALVKAVIRRAIETGRIVDSHGREVGLGSSVFVLMSNCLLGDLKSSGDRDPVLVAEKILELADSSWHLEMSIEGELKTGKRRPEQLPAEDDRIVKPRKGSGVSLDLNLAIGMNNGDGDDGREGSRNSSDLTAEHEHEYSRLAINNYSASSNAADFIDAVDDAIAFEPVDFGPLRRRISDTISEKFTEITGIECSLRVDEDALDRLVGTVWLAGDAMTDVFDGWSDKVLVPAMQKLKNNSKIEDGCIVRLSSVKGRGPRQIDGGDLLPSSVRIAGD